MTSWVSIKRPLKNFKQLIQTILTKGYEGWRRSIIHSEEPTIVLRKYCCNQFELYSLKKSGRKCKTYFRPGSTGYEFMLKNGICKRKIRFEGNKLIQVQTGEKEIETVYEFYENEMMMKITVEKVVAKRYFLRCEAPCCY